MYVNYVCVSFSQAGGSLIRAIATPNPPTFVRGLLTWQVSIASRGVFYHSVLTHNSEVW